MLTSTFKNTALSALAAAIVATSFSAAPAFAGGEGPRESFISTTSSDGVTTTIRSTNGDPTYTRTRTKNGKVVEKKKVKKKLRAFITLHNPDGTSRTVTKPKKSRDFVTRHNPDGTSHTITGTSNNNRAFITIHNPDGTSHTVGGPNR